MTSTTFSPKAGGFCQVFRSSFRQIRGVALLYTALLTVTFPLLLALSLAQVSAAPYSLMEERSRRAMEYLNGALYFALPAFLWTFTIVFAVSLFHYLQNKRSVDLYHALPIRRETMLLGRVCAAFASLAVPFVVLFLLSLAIAALFGVQMQWTYAPEAGCAVGPLFSKLLFSVFNTLAFLCLVVFFLVCCGTVFDAAVSAIAFCGGLPLLLLLCSEYVHIALAGFGSHNIPAIVYESTNPLAAILVMFQTGTMEGPSPALTVWMLIYAAICLALSLFLYRKRRSESAENAFAFPLPRIIIRFLVSACSGLLLGFLVKSLAPGFPMPISVLIGAFLAHLAVEMVYNRGVRGLWKATPAYGVCAALFLVFAPDLRDRRIRLHLPNSRRERCAGGGSHGRGGPQPQGLPLHAVRPWPQHVSFQLRHSARRTGKCGGCGGASSKRPGQSARPRPPAARDKRRRRFLPLHSERRFRDDAQFLLFPCARIVLR